MDYTLETVLLNSDWVTRDAAIVSELSRPTHSISWMLSNCLTLNTEDLFLRIYLGMRAC